MSFAPIYYKALASREWVFFLKQIHVLNLIYTGLWEEDISMKLQ